MNGESTFITTAYLYIILGWLVYQLSGRLKIPASLQTALYALIFTFFISEAALRYLFKYPVTYTELCCEGYTSHLSLHQKLNNRINKLLGVDEIRHTIEFQPGELRNYSTAEFNYPAEELNALGLRGALPGKDQKIITTLGDSFTESFGAPADSAYPFILEQLIKAVNSEWAVLNAGVSGSDPFFDFKLLQKIQDTIPVRQAVFLLNYSDILDVASRGGSERFLESGSVRFNPSPWWEPVYAVSFVFRLFMHKVVKIDWSLFTDEENHRQRMEAIDHIGLLFENQILPWANKNSIAVKAAMHPFVSEVAENNIYYMELCNRLLSIPELEFYDLLPGFRQADNPEKLYWKIDGHFNPEGYRLLAELIFQKAFLNDSLMFTD